MSATPEKIKKREVAALAAIKRRFGSDSDEYGATLFVAHHLEQIDKAYWEKTLGTTNPDPRRILDILVLRSHWGDDEDDGIDTFDFTLPDNATNYVISVRFNLIGRVKDITMES